MRVRRFAPSEEKSVERIFGTPCIENRGLVNEAQGQWSFGGNQDGFLCPPRLLRPRDRSSSHLAGGDCESTRGDLKVRPLGPESPPAAPLDQLPANTGGEG